MSGDSVNIKISYRSFVNVFYYMFFYILIGRNIPCKERERERGERERDTQTDRQTDTARQGGREGGREGGLIVHMYETYRYLPFRISYIGDICIITFTASPLHII